MTQKQLEEKIKSSTYTARDDATLQGQAQNEYQGKLNSALLSAQQAYDTQNTALESQKATVGTQFDQQKEAQQTANAQNLSGVSNNMLARGMGRSTYAASTLNNTAIAGNKALANIEQNRTNALGSIAGQQSQLANQLAQSQAGARSEYESNVAARIQQLKDQEQQRVTSSNDNLNNLLLQLYQLQLQKKQLDYTYEGY